MAEPFYDEIEIEDMDFREDDQMYFYPCPCGDLFRISVEELQAGEEVARCPSCSLIIRVIYNPEDFAPAATDLGEQPEAVTA